MDQLTDIAFPNLGLYFSGLADGISVFGREIKFYAIIIAVAFIFAAMLANKEAKRTKQDSELYLDAFLVMVIPAILGARLYYVIFDWDSYKNNLGEIFRVWNGGLAIYGGVIAGVIALFIFSKVRKVSFGLILDTLVPGLALGQAMGRWGNFFNREAFGGNSDGLFAMRIPVGDIHVAYSDMVTTFAAENGVDYVQVQPTFLYESILCISIFVVLLLLRRKKKVNGEVFLLYAFLYGIGRFVIEGMRTDQLILCHLGEVAVPVSQVVAICFILGAVGMFAVGRHKLNLSYYLDDGEESGENTTVSEDEVEDASRKKDKVEV